MSTLKRSRNKNKCHVFSSENCHFCGCKYHAILHRHVNVMIFMFHVSVKLAREHAGKVEQANKKRQTLLKERQTAFQEQFSQDIDFYKKHGKPGSE